jgi:hypothetical protein
MATLGEFLKANKFQRFDCCVKPGTHKDRKTHRDITCLQFGSMAGVNATSKGWVYMVVIEQQREQEQVPVLPIYIGKTESTIADRMGGIEMEVCLKLME